MMRPQTLGFRNYQGSSRRSSTRTGYSIVIGLAAAGAHVAVALDCGNCGVWVVAVETFPTIATAAGTGAKYEAAATVTKLTCTPPWSAARWRFRQRTRRQFALPPRRNRTQGFAAEALAISSLRDRAAQTKKSAPTKDVAAAASSE